MVGIIWRVWPAALSDASRRNHPQPWRSRSPCAGPCGGVRIRPGAGLRLVPIALLAGCAADGGRDPATAEQGAVQAAAPLQVAFDPASGKGRSVRVEHRYQAASGRSCARVRLVGVTADRRVACQDGPGWVLVPDLMAALDNP